MKVCEEARAELLNEVADISSEALNKSPSKDQWSIKQILEHLSLIEEEIVQNMQAELASGRNEIVGDKPIHLTVNRKHKVTAQESLQPSEQILTLEEIQVKLANSRKKLLDFIDCTDEVLLQERAMHHPGFKMMSLEQWISFIGWHERRHIEQIKEVKEQLAIS